MNGFCLLGSVEVLEEREKMKQDRELRMKKKEYMMRELERLRKQQGLWSDLKFTINNHLCFPQKHLSHYANTDWPLTVPPTRNTMSL